MVLENESPRRHASAHTHTDTPLCTYSDLHAHAHTGRHLPLSVLEGNTRIETTYTLNTPGSSPVKRVESSQVQSSRVRSSKSSQGTETTYTPVLLTSTSMEGASGRAACRPPPECRTQSTRMHACMYVRICAYTSSRPPKWSQVQSGPVGSSRVQSGPVKSGEVQSSQVRSSQVLKSGQVKSSQVKSLPSGGRNYT